jgi:hypothetical protein
MRETSPLTHVSIARQHEDGTVTPVEADSLPEDLRGQCVRAIEQYCAAYGTAPNALVIAPTGQIIASQQSG